MEAGLPTSFLPNYVLTQCVFLILSLFPLSSEAGRLPPFPPETSEEKQLHSEAEGPSPGMNHLAVRVSKLLVRKSLLIFRRLGAKKSINSLEPLHHGR